MTIVEMMVGVALAAVAAAVVYSVFISTQGMYYDTRDIMDNQSESRVILGMMAQEIRSAGSDVQEIGVQRLVTCSADTIHVQSDLNSDGVITSDEPAENVLYYYDAGAKELYRDTGAGPVLVLRNLEACSFQYLDANGDALSPLPLNAATRSLVRAVQVNLSVELNDDSIRDFSSTITLRNDSPSS
jgi:hypothetical protein